jgi:thioredoxin family protein
LPQRESQPTFGAQAPTKDGKPVRFKVKLDGTAPSGDSGADSCPDGTGEIREPRLYQLIRQKGAVKDRTSEIEFLDPGVQAFGSEDAHTNIFE